MKNKKIQPDNPIAYFKQMVRNSLKDEYRQNDNEAKHTLPAGLMLDRHSAIVDNDIQFEDYLTQKGAKDWLMAIEDKKMHHALDRLSQDDLDVVYFLFVLGYTQRELAMLLGISQPALAKRWKKIRKKIKAGYIEVIKKQG